MDSGVLICYNYCFIILQLREKIKMQTTNKISNGAKYQMARKQHKCNQVK